MSNIIADMDKIEKERKKREKISELEKAIKKAESEGKRDDVEKLKKELKDLTHENFLEKFIKDSIRYWE